MDGTIVIPSSDPDVNTNNSRISRLPSGRAIFWVTSLSVSLDFRDSPLNPRQGFFANVQGDYVQKVFGNEQDQGISESSQYIKTAASVSGYIPLGDKTNVLALSTSIGYIFHLAPNSIAWADRYFYMGGVSTLRGFPADTVVPQDVYYANQDDVNSNAHNNFGGESMFLLRAEIRHDFGANLIGVVFGEAGNLWRNTDNFMRSKQGHVAPWILRPVLGLGIHYNTPVGPIAFDVGLNLDKRVYPYWDDADTPEPDDDFINQSFESRWAWYFSIGSAF
jgi:outer membrane protein assembly factor BamA